MAAIIITLILCAITAVVTFTITRSLYINHYKDWYRTAIDSQDIDTESEQTSEQMYKTLVREHDAIFKIDRTIIPEYVSNAFDWGERVSTEGFFCDYYRIVRWLGYDLTLTKRQLPPPPKFKLMASPSAIREELVECMEAEARNNSQ